MQVVKQVTAGDTLSARMVSPLEANDPFVAGVYLQQLPTGTAPTLGSFPGLQLDRSMITVWFSVQDLSAGQTTMTIPPGLAGQTIWLQAVSRGPSGSPNYPLACSDAQRIEVR